MHSTNNSNSDEVGSSETTQPLQQQNTTNNNNVVSFSTDEPSSMVQPPSITDVLANSRDDTLSKLRGTTVERKGAARGKRDAKANEIKEINKSINKKTSVLENMKAECDTARDEEINTYNEVESLERQLAAARQKAKVAKDKSILATQNKKQAEEDLQTDKSNKAAAVKEWKAANDNSKEITNSYIEDKSGIISTFEGYAAGYNGTAGVELPRSKETPMSVANQIYSQSPEDGNVPMEEETVPLSRGDDLGLGNASLGKRKGISTPDQSPSKILVDEASAQLKSMSIANNKDQQQTKKSRSSESSVAMKLIMTDEDDKVSKEDAAVMSNLLNVDMDDNELDNVMFDNNNDDRMDTDSNSGGLQLVVLNYTDKANENRVCIDSNTMDDNSLEDGDVVFVINNSTNEKTICNLDKGNFVDNGNTEYDSEETLVKEILVSDVVRKNIGVSVGDAVSVVKAKDIPDTDKLIIEPDKDHYEAEYQGELFDYFHHYGRVPVKEGDTYVTVEVEIPFRVVESNPSPYSITDINDDAVIEIKLPKEDGSSEDNGSEEGTSETTSNKPAVSSNTTKLTASALGKMKPSEALAALKAHNAPGYEDLDASDTKKMTNIDTLIKNHCSKLMGHMPSDKLLLTTRIKDVVLLQCFKMNILNNQTITMNEIKYRFGGLFFGSANLIASVVDHVTAMVERTNLSSKEELNIFATTSKGRIGGAKYSYMVGKTKKESDGYDSDGDDNDILESCKSHFVKAHYDTKNVNGRILKIRDIATEANVIIVCEKDDVIEWLIRSRILSIEGVKVLLGISKGQGDYAYRATIRKFIFSTPSMICRHIIANDVVFPDALHSKCTNEDGSTRIVPVLVIADCDSAGLVIMEKYTKGPFAILGKLAWLGLHPSRVKNTLESGEESPELKALEQSKKKTTRGKPARGDTDGNFIKYLEGTDLFKRKEFGEELKIVKEFHETRGISYPCSAMEAMGNEETIRIINTVKAFAKNEPCDDLIYINK